MAQIHIKVVPQASSKIRQTASAENSEQVQGPARSCLSWHIIRMHKSMHDMAESKDAWLPGRHGHGMTRHLAGKQAPAPNLLPFNADCMCLGSGQTGSGQAREPTWYSAFWLRWCGQLQGCCVLQVCCRFITTALCLSAQNRCLTQTRGTCSELWAVCGL